MIDIDNIVAAISAVDASEAPQRMAEVLSDERASALGLFRYTPAGDERLWRLSVHESSHAVCAAVWGGAVAKVTVRRDGRGVCEWSIDGDDVPARLARICTALAGSAGEALVNPDALSRHRLSGSYDVANARLLLDQFASDYPSLNLTPLTAARLTQATVHERWPAIFRTAVQLRKVGVLSGADVVRLVQGSA